jgi:hypothetical protein
MNAGKRKVRALERGITWRPHHDSHHVLADMFASARLVYPLCITQRTLVAVETHLRRPGAPCQYGLLLGELCLHPETREPYVLIDGVFECPPPNDWRNLHAQIGTELSGRIVEAERARHVVVGYYRSAAAVVPRPAAADVELFQEFFAQPWQAMLVRDGQAEGGSGAFIRVEPIHRRPYAAPFIELLPKACKVRSAPPSALTWSNYDPAEPVTRLTLPADGAVSSTPREASGSVTPRRILELVRGLAGAPRPVPDGTPPRAAGHPRPGPTPRLAPIERITDIAVARPVVPAADIAPPATSSDVEGHSSPWDSLPRPRALSVGTADGGVDGGSADAALPATVSYGSSPVAGGPPAPHVPVVLTPPAHAARAPTDAPRSSLPAPPVDDREVDVPRAGARSTAAPDDVRARDDVSSIEPIRSSMLERASAERRPPSPTTDAAHARPHAAARAPQLPAPTFPMMLPEEDESGTSPPAATRFIAAGVAVLVVLVVASVWIS